MKEFLRKTRELYYCKRKKLSFSLSRYTHISEPLWMLKYNDKRFKETYNHQRILMKEGRIALGSLVQANSMLFEAGRYDHPAAMVFSEDPYFEEQPYLLEDIASQLYSIKGEDTEDKELQTFADMLEDEMDTLFNVLIPEKLCYGKKVYFTSFMVVRKHLSNGILNIKSFPVLICPEKTRASLILPSKYWCAGTSKSIERGI